MAKGFTVKAEVPKKKKKDEFDIAETRKLIRGKTIVFCLPGRGVSYQFLKSFVGLCFDLVQNGAGIQISQDYSSMVNFARCKCLGANQGYFISACSNTPFLMSTQPNPV